MKKYIISSLVILATLSACKKDKEDEPKPKIDPPVVVEKPLVKNIRDIQLYNQALDTTTSPDVYNFYNITQEKYGNSLNFPIELAFAYYYPNNKSTRHTMGSGTSKTIRSEHGIPNTNNTKVDFFVIDDSNSSLIYDTIKYNVSIGVIFNSKATISTVDNENDAIQSDGFGWSEGEILGFKLKNGKRGLIKLNSDPTGSKNTDGILLPGKIIFDIKMEK